MSSHPTRRERPEPVTIWSFTDRVLVRCPRCQHAATVLACGPEDRPRLVCSVCARSVDWSSPQVSGHCCGGGAPNSVAAGWALLGVPFDPWFREPLWLQTPCCSEVLWAYNERQVVFLRDLVQADLRTRSEDPNGYRNRLLESRLPKWMLAARHRDDVLRGLDRLAARAAES